MKSNKERIRIWVDALRSGNYRQTRKTLRNDEGFCCLGVACDLAIQNGLVIDVEQHEYGEYSYGGKSGVLPYKVYSWFGLSDPNPHDLASMNDDGASFEEIADFIEEVYLTDEA